MTSDDEYQESDQPDAGRLRTMYEETAKREATATARVAELERREAFREAGIDLSNPLHKVVAESYNGELDSAKVKEYVDGLGLNAASPPPPPPETPADERAALERIANAGQGDGTPPPEPDRVKELEKELADAAMRRKPKAVMEDIGRRLAAARGGPVVESWQ